MRLADKVAIVTGGAQGIGRATVEKFHTEGAQVAIFDIDERRGADLERRLGSGERPPVFLRCDVTDDAQVSVAAQSVAERFGRLDVLVNNAGVNAYVAATTMTE